MIKNQILTSKLAICGSQSCKEKHPTHITKQSKVKMNAYLPQNTGILCYSDYAGSKVIILGVNHHKQPDK